MNCEGIRITQSEILRPTRITTVDSGIAEQIQAPLRFSPTGQPAISYYARKYKPRNTQRLTGKFGPYKRSIAKEMLAITPQGLSPSGPAISYMDRSNEDLKYAEFDGTNWNIETIDSEGRIGWNNIS